MGFRLFGGFRMWGNLVSEFVSGRDHDGVSGR